MIFAFFSGVLQVQFREGILKPSEFPVQVWFFWALLAALFFLVVSIQGNRHRLQIFFRSMVHRPMLLEYVEDYDRRGFPSDWGLFLAGFSTAPVWVAWWISGGLDWAPLTITLIGMCSVIFKALLVEQLEGCFHSKCLPGPTMQYFTNIFFGLACWHCWFCFFSTFNGFKCQI